MVVRPRRRRPITKLALKPHRKLPPSRTVALRPLALAVDTHPVAITDVGRNGLAQHF